MHSGVLERQAPVHINSPNLRGPNGDLPAYGAVVHWQSAAAARSRFMSRVGGRLAVGCATRISRVVYEHALWHATLLSVGGNALDLPSLGGTTAAVRVRTVIESNQQIAHPHITLYDDQLNVLKGRALVDVNLNAVNSPFPPALEVRLARLVVGRLRHSG